MGFWSFLIIQIIVIAGVLALLQRLLSRNLSQATSRLQSLSAEYLQRQEELKRKLEEAERQYQEQVAKAKVDAERLVADARQEADVARARTQEQAHHEGERIVQQARGAAEALRKELDREVERRAIGRACELIHEVLPGQLREAVQSHWLDELLSNGLARLEQVTTVETVHEAAVVSAFPLNDEQRARLRRWLRDTLGRDITLSESMDEHLVAGLTITLGSLVLDGSLASKVRQAARYKQAAAD